MPAPNAVLELIERFEYNFDSYRAANYNETRLRREFLDPFFTQLGWDVENRQGYAEAYKDVIHEDAIKIGGATKAPDYCFRIGGARKFFVEAKKPSVNIKEDSAPAFQLRRYAWSAKLPLSVLTDFEEFAVYDCRIQPHQSDKAAVARLLYIPYKEYAARWDEIAAVFSRESILKGAFDKYADDKKSRRGTAEVDAAFLSEIEKWRDALAGNIARRNPELKNRELNYAVQITIDRIIFLRICEDRGIETLGRLQALLNGGDVYNRLCQQFREADDRYNSGLFHFRMEKTRDDQGLDTITPRLKIDDKVLKDILNSLYYPAPYAFDVFPADILGQVYEQFLGKVIRLTPKHQAVIEDKPEVKKAGGVYYTPTYIVNYIVEQTVGKLLEGKTPKQAAELRIVDPACGSGSFLIAAYQKLLDWHQKAYFDDGPEKHAKGKEPTLYLAAGAAWRLTMSERKRILLANIYGVDIDAQAVEVTKLSLLLKALEGETQESVQSQLSLALASGRVLPDLDANIQCGNSLIGPDFYTDKEPVLFDEDEMYRVNAFDWKASFPKILTGDTPGFDAVIGNPPYIHSRSDRHAEAEKTYYFSHYSTVEYQINTFGLFVEKGLNLLGIGGRFGMIIPNYWLSTDYDTRLRKLVFNDFETQEITNVYKVFVNATVDTLILVSSLPEKRAFPKAFRIRSISRNIKSISERLLAVQNQDWTFEKEAVVLSENENLMVSFQNQMELKASKALGDYMTAKFGMKPYQVSKGHPPQSRETLDAKTFDAKTQVDETYCRLLRARNVKRYALKWETDWIKYGEHLAEPRDISLFSGERILIQRIVSGSRLDGTFTGDTYICNTDVITLKSKDVPDSPNLKYLAGILMSSLCAHYVKSRNINLDRAAFPKINTNTLLNFPIVKIDFEKADEKQAHDRMVTLVETMLALHQQLSGAAPTTRTVLQRQIESTDRQIDALVYEFYGLTTEEIALVEQNPS